MSSKFHILVVDDHPIAGLIIATLLKGLGHTVISEAEDGQQALSILHSGHSIGMPVNLVISDWNMPVMDGLALLHTIRATADFQQVPVLMVTAQAETTHFAVAMQAGADGYIDKHFLDAAILKETLDQILMKRGLAG